MKILNLSRLKLNDTHSRYGGAIGHIAHELMSALAERDGIEVVSTVAGADLAYDPPEDLELVHVHGWRDLRRVARERLPDADVATHLYFHEPEYNLAGELPGEYGVPFVIGMCEAPHPRGRDELSGIARVPGVRAVGRRVLGPLHRATFRHADRVICVTDHAREAYADRVLGHRLVTIPYGVDHDRFRPGSEPDPKRVLAVSRLVKRRNVDALVRAAGYLKDGHPDLHVDIVGEGPQRARLKRWAKRRGASEHVTFHGEVAAARLTRLYERASAFYHGSDADGWCQPALEAMAAGTPVIASDRPYAPMVVDGVTGERADPGSPTACYTVLREWFDDPDCMARMGDRAREVVEEHYTWDTIAARYERALRPADGDASASAPEDEPDVREAPRP